MLDRQWKLGEDLSTYDNLFDAITFDELILTLHCNCPKITPKEVRKTVTDILECRLEDLYYLIDNNMDEIIKAALVGREQESN